MAESIATKLKSLDTPSADSRPRHTFKIPEKSRQFPNDPHTLTFVPIRVQDEQDAMKIAEAKGSPAAFQPELVRRSVVAVDGKPIDWGAGGDAWFDNCSAKVRELVYKAYRKVNENDAAETTAFLDSLVIEA